MLCAISALWVPFPFCPSTSLHTLGAHAAVLAAITNTAFSTTDSFSTSAALHLDDPRSRASTPSISRPIHAACRGSPLFPLGCVTTNSKSFLTVCPTASASNGAYDWSTSSSLRSESCLPG